MSLATKLDPEFAAILSNFPPGGLFTDSPDVSVRRHVYEQMIVPAVQAGQGVLPPDTEYEIQDHFIPVEKGVEVRARCIVPVRLTGEDALPLLFWIHGGGWSFGDLNWDDYKLRRAAVYLRLVIVNCEYRLAPEYPFPIPMNDCFAALKYVATNTTVFSSSINLSKGFLIGGMSAGANIVAVITHLARNDDVLRGTPLTGQILVTPPVVHPDYVPARYSDSLRSMETNKNAPIFSRSEFDIFWGFYKAPSTDPRACPLLFPSHMRLPPTYIQVCGLDILRDEGVLYEKVLKRSGVRTRLDMYPGVSHGFDVVAPHTTQGQKFAQDFFGGLEWLLEETRCSARRPSTDSAQSQSEKPVGVKPLTLRSERR
ncbi:esterase lipase [Moniliophthora roreri MCA 2997]|uniref:Esterase lipase n=1 Tax=Moniliophthora roreri (strain MCA 2997) TaxID=1381753 RepID=V2WV67_MONRO|nr:esterase lipase [Moniliophthora roreri MCA 2997]